jgi:site-specific DNA-methyltransferase (adenine-specific)
MWNELKRITKPNSAIVLFGSQPFTSILIASNLQMYKYNWVWEKEKATGFAFSGKQPMRKTEDVCVFYAKQPFYDSKGELLDKPYRHTLPINKAGTMNHMPSTKDTSGVRKYVEYTHAKKHNLIKFPRENANKGAHPTQKPVALMEYLIKTYTNENETVLDFTMGSGTTGVACKNTGRKFIGIELDDNYFDIAKQRILGEQQ